jgi:hypothetical protein
METVLLDLTDLPVGDEGLVAHHTRPAIPPCTELTDGAQGDMLAELAAVPASRRRLLDLAKAVRSGAVPATALIEAAAAPTVHAVLRSFAEVRRLDRQIEVLRVRASASRRAAETVACRRESARLGEAVAAMLSALPIRRRLVRTLAAELLTLADRSERAARALGGPADVDRIHAVEQRVGMRADAFHHRCARLREASARLRTAEHDYVEASTVLEKGRELCESGKR